MSTFYSKEAEIHFDAAGEGDPILLVHGFASDLSVNWKHTGWFDYLRSLGRKVIAPDLRGHGRSSKFHDPQAYSPDRMGRDILDLMDHLAVERADILGYSMGAWLSMYVLAEAPQRFVSGVLGGVGDNFLKDAGRGEKIARAVTTRTPKSITDPTLRMIRDYADHSGADLRALAACSRGVHTGKLPPCDRIYRPVMIVGGQADDFVGAPDLIAATIPCAVVRMIPGRDHLTLLTDKRFKEAAGSFLAAPENACAGLTKKR